MPPFRALATACAAAVAVAVPMATPAFAAADDQYSPATPVASAPGFGAAARRLIDDGLERERAVVAVLRETVVSRVMAGSWRLWLSAPALPRATAIVSRGPVPNDVLDEPAPRAPDDAGLPLGARWRVLHGDASSHVPVAAWMPDLQSADAHAAALRPTMNLSGEWALPDDFSLGVMPGMSIDYAQGRRQPNGTLAVTLGKSWSPQWRTFVDMARDRLAAIPAGSLATSIDAGLRFVAGPGTQIDFAVTHGLTDAAPAFQAGLGLSSRF